jgi:hypothetical protein
VITSGDRREPLFDVHPVTGASIEVFYADSPPGSFAMGGAGWFWHFRRRGFAPDGPAHGPFSSSYSAYRDAMKLGPNAELQERQLTQNITKKYRPASILLPKQLRVEAALVGSGKTLFCSTGCWRARNDSNVRPSDS